MKKITKIPLVASREIQYNTGNEVEGMILYGL